MSPNRNSVLYTVCSPAVLLICSDTCGVTLALCSSGELCRAGRCAGRDAATRGPECGRCSCRVRCRSGQCCQAGREDRQQVLSGHSSLAGVATPPPAQMDFLPGSRAPSLLRSRAPSQAREAHPPAPSKRWSSLLDYRSDR